MKNRPKPQNARLLNAAIMAALLVPVAFVALWYKDSFTPQDNPWLITQPCHKLALLFGPSSTETPESQLAEWPKYQRHDFDWELVVVGSRQDNGFGFVDYKCKDSASERGEIRVFYPGNFVQEAGVVLGQTLRVRAQLNTKFVPGQGLLADVLPEN